MLDRENDVEDIDPPDNQGGGNLDEGAETAPIDPPDNQGGGN